MPRPKQAKVKGHRLNLYPAEYEALRRLAFQQRTSLAEQARRAIALYVEAQRRKK